MTPATQLILKSLKDMTDKNGKVTITNKELMTKADVDESTVTRSIKVLVTEGYIERLSDAGNGKPSIYRVNDKPVPVTGPPANEFPDGCKPKSELERYVHEVLTAAGIPHLHDVAYTVIHPGWKGNHRCDFLIGHNFVLECGREVFAEYRADREAKRKQAERLGIQIIDVPNKAFAPGYFGATSPLRWYPWPTEGLDEFLERIAGLPHPALPEFVARCRKRHARRVADKLMNHDPKPPNGLTWGEYNKARDAERARDERQSFSFKGWETVPPTPEQLAVRAEQARLEAEREAARKYWGDLMGDGAGDVAHPPTLDLARRQPEPDAANVQNDGGLNGLDDPAEEDENETGRMVEWENRLEYGGDDDGESDQMDG